MISTTENLPVIGRSLGRAEAEALIHDIAVLVNAKRKITADMDAEILKIKNRCQPSLTDCDQHIVEAATKLEAWADAHPEIFPKDRKSVEWPMGKFGFRLDTPSLSPASRAFTWAKILAVIVNKKLRKFVRTKLEVDKDAILSRCGTVKNPTRFQTKMLPLLGIKLVQEEKFFVEPDLTKVEVRA